MCDDFGRGSGHLDFLLEVDALPPKDCAEADFTLERTWSGLPDGRRTSSPRSAAKTRYLPARINAERQLAIVGESPGRV